MEITAIQNSLMYIDYKIKDTVSRLKMAILAYSSAPSLYPVVILKDGTKVDFDKKTITIDGDFHLHTQGNMYLTSDKKIVINSDFKNGEFLYFNTELDSDKQPIEQDIKRNTGE